MCYDPIAAHLAHKMCEGKGKSKSGGCMCSKARKTEDYDVCAAARYWEQPAYHEYMAENGKHFNRKAVMWALAQNINADGTRCPKWECSEVWDALETMGYTLDKCERYDAVYLANNYYADFYGADVAVASLDTILKMVVATLEDKDGSKGQTWDMWLAKAMHHCWAIPFEELI